MNKTRQKKNLIHKPKPLPRLDRKASGPKLLTRKGGYFYDNNDYTVEYYRRVLPQPAASQVSYRPACDRAALVVDGVRPQLQPKNGLEMNYLCDILARAFNLHCYGLSRNDSGRFIFSGTMVAYRTHTLKEEEDIIYYPHSVLFFPLDLLCDFLNTRGNPNLGILYNRNSVHYKAVETVCLSQGVLPRKQPSWFAGQSLYEEYEKIWESRPIHTSFDTVYCINDPLDMRNTSFDTFNTILKDWYFNSSKAFIDVEPSEYILDLFLNQLEVHLNRSSKTILVSIGLHGEDDGQVRYGGTLIKQSFFARLQELCEEHTHLTIHVISCFSGTKFSTLTGNMLFSSDHAPSYSLYVDHFCEGLALGKDYYDAHLHAIRLYEKSLLPCSRWHTDGSLKTTVIAVPLLGYAGYGLAKK